MFSYIYYLDWEKIKYRNNHFLSYFSSYMHLPFLKHGIIVGDLKWPWSWPILHSLLSLFFFSLFYHFFWCRRFWNFFFIGLFGVFPEAVVAQHGNLGFERWFRDGWKRKREGFCFFVFFKIVSVLLWFQIDVGQSRGK